MKPSKLTMAANDGKIQLALRNTVDTKKMIANDSTR